MKKPKKIEDLLTEEEQKILGQIPIDRFLNRGKIYFERCPICGGSGFTVKDGAYDCKSCGRHGSIKDLARELGLDDPAEHEPGKSKAKRYKYMQQEQAPELLSALGKMGIKEEIVKKYNVKLRDFDLVLEREKGKRGGIKSAPMLFYHTDPRDPEVIKYISQLWALILPLEQGVEEAEGGNKWWNVEEGMTPTAFGWQFINYELPYIYVTSDPMSCLQLVSAGLKNVVSAPGNYIHDRGEEWLTNDRLQFSQFDEIRVIGSAPWTATEDPLKAAIKRRFPGKAYTLPAWQYEDGKTPGELVRKYGGNFMKIEKQFACAGKEAVVQLADAAWIDSTSLPKIKTGIREIDGIFGGGFTLGTVVTLTGEAGAGKSTFVSQLMCEFIRQKHPVFLYSGELEAWQQKEWIAGQAVGAAGVKKKALPGGYEVYSVKEEWRKPVDAFLRDLLYTYDQNSFVASNERSEEKYILKQAKYAVENLGCKVVVIDNVTTAIDTAGPENPYDRQTEFMRAVTRFALQKQVLVILIAHLKKPAAGENSVTLNSIFGSGALTKLAHTVLVYARDDSIPESHRLLHVLKNRMNNGILTTKDRKIELYFDPSSKRIGSATSPCVTVYVKKPA